MQDGLDGVFTFFQSAERLKDTLRTGRTSAGRAESVAEHSWRLCLLVLMFADELSAYDLRKMLMLCVVHDLGEAVTGDVPAVDQCEGDGRAERERAGMLTLCEPLPQHSRDALLALYDEYSSAVSPEAALVKGFDKIETMSQHLLGNDEPDFDYGFNLTYGTRWTGGHPILRQLRTLVDAETAKRIEVRSMTHFAPG